MKKFMTAVTAVSLSAMMLAGCGKADVQQESTVPVSYTHLGRPIGVVPFQWAGPGAAPEDIGGIVAADLRNSCLLYTSRCV